MSILKVGTLCVAVGGSGVNAGRIVRIVQYVGRVACDPSMVEVYFIETASGRPFKSVTHYPARGAPYSARDRFSRCFAERRRLRPLVDAPVAEAREEERFVDAA